jgi:UDP-N-acetylglucosamine transferase subunit ALG13
MKICLAASGGGHLRQVLELRSGWQSYDNVIVTEDTALGRSLQGEYRTYFVDHFAIGQAKLGRPFTMLRGAVRNFRQAIAICRKERPDIVITTGAGAVFWICVIAKVSGARLFLIETFARFDRPSLFGRITRRLADEVIVQSEKIARMWGGTKFFDPFRLLDKPRPDKEPLLFVTVGATLGFPRLINAVLSLKAEGKLPERVIMQVGDTALPACIPDNVEIVRELSFSEIKDMLRRADFVVCHGGTGSIVTALEAGCRTIVFPRQFSRGEHYDDHQEEISEAMRTRGLVEVVREESELEDAIARARSQKPQVATTDFGPLATYIADKLALLSAAPSFAPEATMLAPTEAPD